MVVRADKLLTSLKAHPLLAGLGAEVLARLAVDATAINILRGNILFREGDQAGGAYIVLRGQIKLSLQNGHGREKVLDLIGPGGNFGEAALILDKPQPVTAEAVTDVELIYLNKTVILREITDNGVFSERLVACLAQRIYNYTESMRGHMLLSGTQRVICYLLDIVPDEQWRENVAITFPVRKGVIASKLNLTHEHFSRILHDLTSAELIEVAGQRVRIRDVNRLRSYQAA